MKNLIILFYWKMRLRWANYMAGVIGNHVTLASRWDSLSVEEKIATLEAIVGCIEGRSESKDISNEDL